ncbi:MAG TPA: glycosyltransferase, partial [Candidatus Dormibacteraeota bacterium]|nr:glycosyltransferase [Candidatus Dormibacteraeota bacterium]
IGSQKINGVIRQHLPILLEKYHIIHICGKGNVDESINEQGYVQYEYVHDELNDIFAVTDFVISRAGSNAIFEFLALNIPMLLIPLSLNASRGDQIDNAKSFEQQGFAHVLLEEDVTDESLLQGIEHLTTNLTTYKAQLQTDDSEISRKKVIQTIEEMAK